MSNILNVSLITVNGTSFLDVEDHGGQNIVHANAKPTTITWKLTGVLTQGYFSANDAFQWVLIVPPTGTFDPFKVGDNGNSISVVDHHLNSTSNGNYTYFLRVHYNNQVYTTTMSFAIATTNNPNIVNR